jgi:hypothetical protein
LLETIAIGNHIENRPAQASLADLLQNETVATLADPVAAVRRLNDSQAGRDSLVKDNATAFEQTGEDETVGGHKMLDDVLPRQGLYVRNAVAKRSECFLWNL